MSLRNQLMASATALLAAFNPISTAQAMDVDARINYRGPFFKQIDAAEGGDGLASVAASGIALKFEEASQGDLSKPKIVQDSRGGYASVAVVGKDQIIGCMARRNDNVVSNGFAKFAINTRTGAVEVNKIDSDCKSVIQAGMKAMTAPTSVGESSSDGRITPAAAPAPITGPRSEAPLSGPTLAARP
jgi:hypothetical protein